MVSEFEQVESEELDSGAVMETSDPREEIDSDDGEALPVYLWRPNQTTEALAEWESHTKVRLNDISHGITCEYNMICCVQIVVCNICL